MSRLPGHELVSEGAPFEADGRSSYPTRWMGGTGGTGRGKCSCGELSDVLYSGAKRKSWHRGHKDGIMASDPSTNANTKEPPVSAFTTDLQPDH